MPTISVVIPAFNAATTIAAALNSVIPQQPHEIIVVDDGSTDGTDDVVRGFSATLIRQPENRGAAVARQLGSEASTGDYIAYLDADDQWPSTRHAIAQEVLVEYPVDWMFGDCERAGVRNLTFHPWAKSVLTRGQRDAYIKRLERAEGLSLILRGFPMFPSTLIVKRGALKAVGGWDARFRRCQDFDLAIRLAEEFPLNFQDDICAVIGLHQGNSDESEYVIKQTRGDIEVLLARGDYPEALAGKYRGLGYALRKAGQYAEARDAYREATRWDWTFSAALRFWILSAATWCSEPRT